MGNHDDGHPIKTNDEETQSGLVTNWFPSRRPTPEEARSFVGGWVEMVHLPNGDQMLVNEEGILHNMPRNPQASAMYGGLIVGPAIILRGDYRWD
jgi:hypothetical protein